MEKQLINLALLNGGSLSEKTKTNLDLYLRTKLQSAGSSGLTDSGNQQQTSIIGNLIGVSQSVNSFVAGQITGVNVEKLNQKVEQLNRIFSESEDKIQDFAENVENDINSLTDSIINLNEDVATLKQRLETQEIESQTLNQSLSTLEANIERFINFSYQVVQNLDEQIRMNTGNIDQLINRKVEFNDFIDQINRLDQRIDDEEERAINAELKEVDKRKKLLREEAQVRKKTDKNINKRLQNVEQRAKKNKRDLTSSINKLSTSVDSLEADYQTQGVINQEMVNVLRKLNKENIESQEKFRKLKKTPFGAII
jgi:chromosome segregation ATPase